MSNSITSPKSEEELAEAIRSAKGSLRIKGGGTRAIGSVNCDSELTTSELSGITLYDPGALTIVAKAGTTLAVIEAAVAQENQRLAFEPMDHRRLLETTGQPTIGGVVAANVSGPRRVQVGACRDHLLGVRFVDGRGDIKKNGGRVMKNVTGYDLVKLMAGSFGTLGVLSEVSLKVLPQVEATAVVLINGLSNEKAVETMSRALGSPFEVSGAAHTPFGLDSHPVTMLRLEGFEGSVAYRSQALKELLSDCGDLAVETDPTRTAAGWKWVCDVETFQGESGDVWRISCVPSQAPELAQRAGGDVLFDWGGGLVWARVPEGHDLRSELGAFDGHATRVRTQGLVDTPAFSPEVPLLAKFSAGLRLKFDPRGILNSGLMG